VSAPVKVSFVSVLVNADAATLAASLSLLPRDANHQRGTFPNATLLLHPISTISSTTPSSSDGDVRHLRFGGNDVDATLEGKDATMGDAQKLLGNYGLLYRLALDDNNTPLINAHAAIAPRGGAWGGVARVTKKTAGNGSDVALPKSQETLGSTTDAI